MQILGLLVRTRSDTLTQIGFKHAEEILQASRESGHIFIDIAAEMATRENVLRIIEGIGSPSGSFLKLIIFYCHGNSNSPIDQNGEDFITTDAISKFTGWGVYCIGCDVGQNLGHRLLAAGANFLIAFNATVMIVLPHADEVFAGLNVGIVRILRDGIGPFAAAESMRQFFLKSIEHIGSEGNQYSLVRRMALRSHASALEYHGRSISQDLIKIKPGQRQAAEYQSFVAKTLHEIFHPHLDEPHLEVSNESGSSRYDIVFMNRAERGFWHDIKMSRGNSIVIFDTKNKRKLQPSDADQMLRYSGPWRGQVIFIVCRDQPSDSFRTRCADLLKEKGVCLVVISDQDLEEMHTLAEQSQDPIIAIEKLYRERIESA